MVQNFCEIAENYMNVNFCDINFVLASTRTINVVALPTILTRGVNIGLEVCKCEEKRIKRN